MRRDGRGVAMRTVTCDAGRRPGTAGADTPGALGLGEAGAGTTRATSSSSSPSSSPRWMMALLTFLATVTLRFSSAGGARMVAPTDDPMRFGGSASGGFRDGPGEVARYYHPQGLAVSSDGKEVYVADSWNHRIRRVDVATGHTTTLAGSVPGFQDGEAHQAAFHYPNSVAVSPDGAFVFVSDAWNHRIRAVVLGTGVVTTVAGKGFPGFRDGGRAEARFYYPAGIVLSPDGSTLFVSDSWNNRIRAVKVRSGDTFTVAGGARGFADGAVGESMFSQPRGIDVSRDGQTIYVADTGNNRVRAVILASKAVVTLAGSGVRGFRDGDPLDARFARPTGVLAALEGDQVFVADGGNAMVRSVPVPPDLASVAAEGGEVAGPGEVFTVSRAPSTLDDPRAAFGNAAGGGGGFKPGVLGGAGHVGNRRNADFGFGATAVTNGAGKAVVGQLKSPFDLGGVPSEARGRIFLTDRDTHTVLSLDSSTGRVTPLSGAGVAPTNALGAIYDTSRKRGGPGPGGEVGATRAAGVDGGVEAHATESDWMREAMVNAARAAGDASLAGPALRPSASSSAASAGGDREVGASAARVARQHHTWWFGASRPSGLERQVTSSDGAGDEASESGGASWQQQQQQQQQQQGGGGGLWAWVLWAGAVLTAVYVAGYIQPEAAAAARRVAAAVTSRVAAVAVAVAVAVAARVAPGEGPRAVVSRALARLRRSSLGRAATFAAARGASAAAALCGPVAGAVAPSLRRLKPWIAALHMALAALARRLPVAAYAYLSPCLAPLERAASRSRLVARAQSAWSRARPLFRACVVFTVEMKAAARAAFRRAAAAANDAAGHDGDGQGQGQGRGGGGGGWSRGGDGGGGGGGGGTWAPYGGGTAVGRSGVAPDGSMWPDAGNDHHRPGLGGMAGAGGGGAGAPPGTRIMRHPPRMERMPADVASSLSAQRQRAGAGPGMVMPPNLQQQRHQLQLGAGGVVIGGGGGGGGGGGSNGGGAVYADSLSNDVSYADFTPPTRMMALAGSKARSGSAKEL